LECRENVVIHCRGPRGAEFCDRKCQGGHRLLMGMKDVLRDGFIKEGSTGRQAARMLALVPVRGNQISTVGRAVDGSLAFGAAAVHSGGGLFLLAFVLTTGWLRP